jgi:hypothetical protein
MSNKNSVCNVTGIGLYSEKVKYIYIYYFFDWNIRIHNFIFERAEFCLYAVLNFC